LVSAIGLFPASPTAWAQGVGTSAEITGTVIDPAGAAIPNAKVTVSDVEKGVKRTVQADSSGQYRVAGLPPSHYRVSAEFSGFQTEVQTDVELTVGQVIPLDFHLKLSGISGQVEVTSELPTVETERGSQADTLTQNYIVNLPIDRRDYLTFTLLAPGVSNSTRLASDQDFRVKQTPQSGLSFYGSNGRGNSITVDGGEANDDAGGVRLTLGQDAVQEFQINRSNYSAELGGASGATINIVSKSGSNQVHGTLFGFFRNDALDAADPFAKTQALAPGAVFNPLQPDSLATNTKNSLSRYQYGGSAGFPIKKDKSFLFVSFEGLLQNAQNSVPILTNTAELRPTAPQQAIINNLATTPGTVTCFPGVMITGPQCAGALTSAFTVSQVTGLSAGQAALNTFLVNALESNGGLFNYNTREYLASGRFDHRFSDSDQFSLSYRYGHDLEENPDVQSLTGFSAGSLTRTYDNNILAAWYHQFSSTKQNEFHFQFDYASSRYVPNEPGEVGLQIPGFVNNLGTSIFLPDFSYTRRYEIADNFTLVKGHHTIKFGGSELLRGNHTESHTFFPGRFIFSGSLPASLISPQLPPTVPLNPLQAASFGLPLAYQQGFGNPTYPYYTRPFTSVFAQDSWAITSNFTLNYGLRYELDTQFKPLSTYTKDFAPRVSFAWDPFKDHKTVIRGGYGIFYSQIYAQIPDVDLSLGALNANKSSVGNSTNAGQVNNLTAICGIAGIPAFPGNGSSPCNREISIYLFFPPGVVPVPNPKLNSFTIFQTLFAQGAITCTTPPPGSFACITPASLAQFGLNVTNSGPLAPPAVVFVEQPGFRPPYSQQAEFGIEREVAPGVSISASYIYSHTLDLPVALDTNLLNAPLTAIRLANGKTVTYRNWNSSIATDPLFGQEAAVSGPNAGQPVGVAGYPCANPFSCFINPLIFQNNQYSSKSSAIYQAGILEVKKRFSNHFTAFGNYTYSKGFDTGTDFNTDYGPQDPLNLGADRSLSEFDERHKVVIAGLLDSPWKNPILGGFQLAPIFSYNSGHPFNLLAGGEVNGDNHTTNERPIGAGRDTGLGPSYTTFDMRLSWHHKIAEKANLLLTAEGFNIANHTNYASVNNEVSPLFGIGAPCTTVLPCATGNTSFAVHGTAAFSPSTPLGFTSAFPKRQVQLGVRLEF
jgi:Carboxypeptidase regulatory-like domain